jgi:hypothetical protein
LTQIAQKRVPPNSEAQGDSARNFYGRPPYCKQQRNRYHDASDNYSFNQDIHEMSPEK